SSPLSIPTGYVTVLPGENEIDPTTIEGLATSLTSTSVSGIFPTNTVETELITNDDSFPFLSSSLSHSILDPESPTLLLNNDNDQLWMNNIMNKISTLKFVYYFYFVLLGIATGLCLSGVFSL